MSGAPSRLGLLAAGLAAACAAGLGLLAASNQSQGLPAEVPWPLVLTSLLATPAVIGGLGAVSGRRSLLIAAGILCLVESILSFSGVTLVFLVPALIFFRAAAAAPPARGEPLRLLHWLALVALAVPVALLVILNLGVFGVVGLVAIGGLAPLLVRRGQFSVPWREALIGVAVVGLVLGALYSAFANTQTICWDARSTPAGIVSERIPVQDEFGPIGGDTGIVASGCAGGQPTIEGAALTGILLVGAMAIAVQATRP